MDSPPTTTFTRHRTGIYLSRTSLVIITAIVLCCLCGVAALLYHFLQCHNNLTPACNLDPHDHNNHHHHHHGANGNEATLGSTEDAKNETEVIDLFLPRSVVPLQYDLKFIPFLDESNFTYNGVAKIRVKVVESCKNITLHAKALKIDKPSLSVRLARDTGAVLTVESQYIVEEKQFYVIEMEEELQANEIYEVHINFKGMLNDDLEGFYRSKYEVGNTTR